MSSFVQRMIGAAKLDAAIYEEVEADTASMGQAMGVVVLAGIAGGLGALGADGARAFVPAVIAGLLGWYVWAFFTWLAGTKLLPMPETNADVGQLLRTLGFAAAPGLLKIFGSLPLVGDVVSFAASLWMLAAMTVAVRQALDYRSTGRAIAVCVVGFLVYLAILTTIAVVFGVGAGLLGGALSR